MQRLSSTCTRIRSNLLRYRTQEILLVISKCMIVPKSLHGVCHRLNLNTDRWTSNNICINSSRSSSTLEVMQSNKYLNECRILKSFLQIIYLNRRRKCYHRRVLKISHHLQRYMPKKDRTINLVEIQGNNYQFNKRLLIELSQKSIDFLLFLIVAFRINFILSRTQRQKILSYVRKPSDKERINRSLSKQIPIKLHSKQKRLLCILKTDSKVGFQVASLIKDTINLQAFVLLISMWIIVVWRLLHHHKMGIIIIIWVLHHIHWIHNRYKTSRKSHSWNSK